ncbi:uncharacterized protein [Danio rerio]|uniref:Tubulin polymerization-promoting protein n=3 Tax=Danio rerio TaxID=7955 RepID=H9GXR8_DANRE|nr:uncharacterized protein LOC100150882 [Danio rerio]|eukprot:XP_001923157.1 uncharacterized protein LOC100150882 [Danio rerio]
MERLRVSLFLLLLFCSPCLSEGKTFFTHLGTLCAEDCKPDGGEYKCKSTDEDGKSQSMYCSPQENVDFRGRQCQADSKCAKHGEDYSWCRINTFSWGYCGLVKEDQTLGDAGEDHHNTSPHRNRRDEVVLDTIDDLANRRRTTFLAEGAQNHIADGNNYRSEAAILIGNWDNSYLVSQTRSNLIKTKSIRIDMQGMVNRHNLRYHNLQIQVNVPRGGNMPSTTLSQVFVPENIYVPDRYVRRAFQESMVRRARIFIDVSSINIPRKLISGYMFCRKPK